MHDLITQLLGYLRGIWRFRWWVLAVAWVVSVGGWIVISQLPDQYQASSRVYVDTQSLLKPLLRGLAVQGNEQQRLVMMTKTLLSRPNLEKVMRMVDLDLEANSDEKADEIIDRLKKGIKFQSTNRLNLYTISYQDDDPELAKQVVKSLLTIFVESNLGDTRKEQDSVRQFLEQQINEYEQRLTEAEERRTRFRQKNLAFLPGERGGYYARLQQTQVELKQAELELKIQRDRLKVLSEQVAGEVPTASVDLPPSLLDARISDLQSQLDSLLLKYTERHPDVIALKNTLDQLKKKKKAESRMARKSGGTANPVYQQIRIQQAQVEADVAAKEAVVEEYKKRIEALKKAVDKVLQVEAEEAQLNRDYDIIKKQYQELLTRLESARLSQDADSRSDSVRFRIVDPPRVPAKPSGPPRLLLSSGVVIAGLALGGLLGFLMSQIRPTFDNRRELNEITDLPVLGSVSMIWTTAQVKKRQRRHVGFLFGLLGLVSLYGLVVASYLFEVNLLDLNWSTYIDKVRSLAGI